jgi:hypothetical protein
MSDIEVVFNTCYGGFSLTEECIEYLKANEYPYDEKFWDISNGSKNARSDKTFIKLLKDFGLENAGKKPYSSLKIALVPAHYKWHITEYDGLEGVVGEFPWEDLARALLEGENTPLINSIKNGEIVIPKKSHI